MERESRGEIEDGDEESDGADINNVNQVTKPAYRKCHTTVDRLRS